MYIAVQIHRRDKYIVWRHRVRPRLTPQTKSTSVGRDRRSGRVPSRLRPSTQTTRRVTHHDGRSRSDALSLSMAPLSRRVASLGDSDLEAPLNPSSVKHNSVSAHGSTVRDGETQKWHDGIAGGVVSLYSVMAYTLLTVTTFTISLPTCRQAITSLGGTPRLSGAVMGFMPLASGFAQLPLLLVLKRVPLRTVLLTFCVVLCASQVLLCCTTCGAGWLSYPCLPLCLPPSHDLRCL